MKRVSPSFLTFLLRKWSVFATLDTLLGFLTRKYFSHDFGFLMFSIPDNRFASLEDHSCVFQIWSIFFWRSFCVEKLIPQVVFFYRLKNTCLFLRMLHSIVLLVLWSWWVFGAFVFDIKNIKRNDFLRQAGRRLELLTFFKRKFSDTAFSLFLSSFYVCPRKQWSQKNILKLALGGNISIDESRCKHFCWD